MTKLWKRCIIKTVKGYRGYPRKIQKGRNETEFNEFIGRARERATAARLNLGVAKDALELVEATLYLRCDYKELGSNNTERDAAHFIKIKSEDSEYQEALAEYRRAEAVKLQADDDLSVAEDVRRDFENSLWSAYLRAQHNMIVDAVDFVRYGLSRNKENKDGWYKQREETW